MKEKNIRNNLLAAWAITKKDMRIYYLKPGTLMFGIMFPLFLFFSFAVGRNLSPSVLLPALISLIVLFSATSIGPAAIPLERRVKTFDRLLSAPISFLAVILGKTLGGILFSLFINFIALLLSWFFLRVVIANIFILIFGIILSSLCFSLLGIMFAMFPTENPGDIMIMLNFVRLPLMFISGIFAPVETLSFWKRFISLFSPLTYVNDLLRLGFEGKTYFYLITDIIVILVFSCIFLFVGLQLDRRFRD